MKMLLAAALASVALTTPATAARFYYRVGDRVPFWYLIDLADGDQPKANYVLEAPIVSLRGVDTRQAELVIERKACMKRELIPGLAGAAPTSSCAYADDVEKRSAQVARANCMANTWTTLSGQSMSFEGLAEEKLLKAGVRFKVSEAYGDDTIDGPRYRAAVEQFKAMCPQSYMRAWEGE